MAGTVEITQYSADALIVTYLGVNISPGLGDGDDAIAVERRNPTFELTTGIQGDGCLSKSRDRSATIKLKYLQNSSSGKFLSGKLNASELGAVVSGPLIITEIGGDAKVIANKTVIKGQASFKRGRNQNFVEFEFLCADATINHGEGIAL